MTCALSASHLSMSSAERSRSLRAPRAGMMCVFARMVHLVMVFGSRPLRPKASQSLAVALCVLGLGVLIYPLAATGVPLGLVLAVVAGFSWGAGTVYIKWAGLPFDPLVLAFWQLVVAFAVVGASLFVVDGRLNLDHAHATSILAAAFAGIAGSALAYTMWFEIVRRLPAATASLGVLGIPVVGVVSTVLVTGERLSGADIIGFALIFAASACVLLAPSAPAKA